MPNWCMNDLLIVGSKEVIQEIADSGLQLSKLVPYPTELEKFGKVIPVPKNEIKARKELKKKYGCDNLYDWCIENWGTKWDLNVGHIDVTKPFKTKTFEQKEWSISASFDSAWSPPVDAFEAIYNKYKDRGIEIELQYIETGCSFLGKATGADGQFKDQFFEYKNSSELKKIVKELNHYMGENELESLCMDEEDCDSFSCDSDNCNSCESSSDSEVETVKEPPAKSEKKKVTKKPAKKSTSSTTKKTSKKPVKKASSTDKKKTAKVTKKTVTKKSKAVKK